MKPEDWFVDVVMRGLQQLMTLSLEGQPAAEIIKGTVQAWCIALWSRKQWVEHLDRDRIAEGFITLMATSKRWPQPADLLVAIKPREEPLMLTKKLSKQEREANLDKLHAIVESIGIKTNRS